MGGKMATLKSTARLTLFCAAYVTFGVIVGLAGCKSFSGNKVVKASTFRRRLNEVGKIERYDMDAMDVLLSGSGSSRHLLGRPPSPPPPYQLHVASVNLKTATRGAVKSDSAEYDAQSHEFHRVCMHATNNTPTDPAYADWESDGKATAKLNEMKAAELLDPIGLLREGCKCMGTRGGFKTPFCIYIHARTPFLSRAANEAGKTVWKKKPGD